VAGDVDPDGVEAGQAASSRIKVAEILSNLSTAEFAEYRRLEGLKHPSQGQRQRLAELWTIAAERNLDRLTGPPASEMDELSHGEAVDNPVNAERDQETTSEGREPGSSANPVISPNRTNGGDSGRSFGGDPELASAAGSDLLTVVAGIQRERQKDFLRQVEENLGEDTGRVKSAASDANRADLVGHGLDVAVDCRTNDQIQLCARIVAAGLDRHATDQNRRRAHLLLGILSQLHEDHITILREVGAARPVAGAVVRRRSQGNGIDARALSQRLPELADVIDQLMAWLAALGLVENVGEIGVGPLSRLVPGKWVATKLGAQLLDPQGAS
jgi:hypothetical protein